MKNVTDPLNVVSMNISNGNDTHMNADTELTNVFMRPFIYKPLSVVTQVRLHRLVWNINIQSSCILPKFQLMTSVCEAKSIQGDGNRFFRALSYTVSGSVNGHMKLCWKTVDHLATQWSRIQQIFDNWTILYSKTFKHLKHEMLWFFSNRDWNLGSCSPTAGWHTHLQWSQMELITTHSNTSLSATSCQKWWGTEITMIL